LSAPVLVSFFFTIGDFQLRANLIRAIIAVSFADIFRNNCMKNGLLPVVLSDAEINELMNRAKAPEGYEITVDLEARQVRDAAGFSAGFEIGDFQQDCLLNGLDDIGLTLQYETEIAAFENTRPAWI